MPNRSGKRPRDLNRLAADLVQDATDETQEPEAGDLSSYAQALGRRGGLKGGRARAATLSAEERSRIARKAATARWASRGSDG